jgi:hypothetical protein
MVVMGGGGGRRGNCDEIQEIGTTLARWSCLVPAASSSLFRLAIRSINRPRQGRAGQGSLGWSVGRWARLLQSGTRNLELGATCPSW